MWQPFRVTQNPRNFSSHNVLSNSKNILPTTQKRILKQWRRLGRESVMFSEIESFSITRPSCLTERQVLWYSDVKEGHWLRHKCLASLVENSRCGCMCVCVSLNIYAHTHTHCLWWWLGTMRMDESEPTEFALQRTFSKGILQHSFYGWPLDFVGS